MTFGLTPEEFSLLDQILIAPLKMHACQVWIFGSRARGNHHRFSDIDILFKVPEGRSLPPGFLAEVTERLEESRLSCKVDLVDDQFLSESYRSNVDSEKISL